MIRWLRIRWIPLVVALVTLAVGGLISFLVLDARQSGVRSLRESLLAEVSATARSQDQRVATNLAGGAGLAQQPWEFVVDSDADAGLLTDLLQFIPDLRTGFLVTDASGTITQGVNLADRSVVGMPYDRPGFDELLRSPQFLSGRGGYLPVEQGLTASLPTLASVYPILDPTSGVLRGTFVFESEVAADSAFNEEIGQLGRGETGEYLFYDAFGMVIAASEPAQIATEVSDPFLIDAPPGIATRDGDVVVIQEVPSAGWRVAFIQDQDEFESGLVGPLQSIGQVIALFSVLLGAGLFMLLAQRLQAARDEQDRLRQLAASQEEFISIVSHELRTPVAGVLGFLQTTIDHWETMSDSARLEAVRRSASNARRLQALARDVLDSETVESARMTFAMTEGDLVHEVDVAAESARRSVHPNQQITVTRQIGVAPVEIDADRIQQVLGNLVDNAARVSPLSEPVVIDVGRDDDMVVVSVTDRGPGLAPGSEERIFDRFQRGEAGAVSGTGLGLYIARQIVEAHGGTIRVESVAGAGATFVFRLPISQRSRPAD